MDRSDQRDVVLLAALGTQPSSLLRLLNRHPEIVAPPPVRLTSLLHTISRDAVRTARQTDGRSLSTPSEIVAFAGGPSAAALKAVFDETRRCSLSRIVVLSDPDRLTFPLSDVTGMDVILLRPGPRLLGFADLPGAYEKHVAALVHHDVEGLASRARVWGVDETRIFSINEDDAFEEPGLSDLLAFLDADTSLATSILSSDPAKQATGAD